MEDRKVCAIVPCLNPDDKFLEVIDALQNGGFTYILVVDDGSSVNYRSYFDIAEQRGCTVLRHHINLGKGRAMKMAFNHYLNDPRGCCGVVTVDADNQHRIDDIIACSEEMMAHPEAMVLGCRDFDLPHVPKKSRVGNKVMCKVFRYLCGVNISDTQTGLHAMSDAVTKELLEIPGERFEYETNLLLEMKKKAIPFREVKIETVYIEENASSHFHPVRDTLRIAKIIVKFMAASLSTTLLDLLLFALLQGWLGSFLEPTLSILIATIGARVVSSVCNFMINRSLVFGGTKSKGAVFKYYTVALFQMGLSYGGVLGLTLLGVHSVLAKILVDTLLFFISFFVQREWVFK